MIAFILRMSLLLCVLVIVMIIGVIGFGRMVNNHLFAYADTSASNLRLLDIRTGIQTIFAKRADLELPQWIPHDNRLSFVRWNETGRQVYITNLAQGQIQQLIDTSTLDMEFASVELMRWSSDGQYLAYMVNIEGDKFFAIVDKTGRDIVPMRELRLANVSDIVWSADNEMVYFLHYGTRAITGNQFHIMQNQLGANEIIVAIPDVIEAVYPSPAGDTLLIRQRATQTLDVFDLLTRTFTARILLETTESNRQHRIAWSPDGTAFVVAQYRPASNEVITMLYADDNHLRDTVTFPMPDGGNGISTLSLSNAPYTVVFAPSLLSACFVRLDRAAPVCRDQWQFLFPIGFNFR